MGSRLVIAEKPSVSRAISDVIGATKKENGYLTGNGYIVSWCVGHLIELAAPSVYNEKYAKWRKEDLPIKPNPWKYTISAGTKEQFNILKRLMADPGVDSIICATDAGREGELIFRLVYNLCDCKKPVERLWISSMEDSAIKEGFANLKPASRYDRLYDAALCRAQADWIVGINATRLFSTMYKQTFHVGRVMTPTLSMLVQREAQIAAFQAMPFYHVELNFGDFAAKSERLQNRMEAEQIATRCAGKEAKIISIESKDKVENPPKLYDLTSLQRDANRMLGYTAQQTLDYAQTLYEKKLCTYPRTDSRYLTEHMENSTRVLAETVANALPFAMGDPIPCNPSRVIDNAKVTDHHAILPTSLVADVDLLSLPAGERNTLFILMMRLLCAVGEPCRMEETMLKMECEDVGFSAKGLCVTHKGWRIVDAEIGKWLDHKVEKKEAKENTLPKLHDAMIFRDVKTSINEGKTTAPKHFTEDTLLSAMETAGVEDLPEEVEYKGLGTPATRAGILEKLVKVGLMERKGKKKATILLPTTKGVSLITILPEELQSPALTSEWEQQLRQIEQSQLTADVFLRDICDMVDNLVRSSQPIKDAHILFPDERKTVGTCPRCGSMVVETPKSFACSNDDDCRFVLWKDNHFFKSKRKALTAAMTIALLKEGRVKVKGLYSEKTKRTYDATVILDDTGDQFVNFKLEF